MNLRSIKWLAFGLGIPFAGSIGILHNSIGIPSVNGTGLHWAKIERGNWNAIGLHVSFDGLVHIETLEQLSQKEASSTKASPASVSTSIPSIALNQIKSVETDRLIVQREGKPYDTRLHGRVYPTVALENDWLSVGQVDDDWTLTGTLDSTSLNLTKIPISLEIPEDATLKLQFNIRVSNLEEPILGTLQNIELTHPLVSNKIRISSLDMTARQTDHGWTGTFISQQKSSSIEWMLIDSPEDPEQPNWAINYSVSLEDLTTWFGTNIPNAKPLGHWVGTLTPTEGSISGQNLGFEGQLYGLHRLKSGQPITYQPIHSTSTRLLGPNLRNWTSYAQLGWLAKAVIAGEDAPFFTHDGFNEEGLTRALNELLKDNESPIGGSSITQQVAKNLFTGNDVTLDRKVEEMVYTLGLEDALSKEAILTLYLNSIEFGDGIYGITEACNQYFLKKPQYLTVKEAVFLAAILPNPRDGYRRAKLGRPPTRRMRAILENLVDGNQISRFVMNEAMREPLRLLLPVE